MWFRADEMQQQQDEHASDDDIDQDLNDESQLGDASARTYDLDDDQPGLSENKVLIEFTK